MNAEDIAQRCSQIAEDNKAEDILVMEVTDLIVITDFFVICSGTSERHVKAIAGEIEHILKKEGVRPLRTEGYQTPKWVLLDYGDVIVHVFLDEVRKYYELEDLWADAPRHPVKTK